MSSEDNPFMMAHSNSHTVFETTKRLLAQAINDGLATASIRTQSLSASSTERHLYVQPPGVSGTNCNIRIICTLGTDTYVEVKEGRVVGFLRPDYLCPPLVLIDKTTGYSIEELHPTPVCRLIARWHNGVHGESLASMLHELESSVEMQQQWLDHTASLPPLGLTSSLIDWENSIIWGHPIHPLHRTYLPLPPLTRNPNLSTILQPSITFLSIPRASLMTSGPFQSTLQPLLQALNINPLESPDHTIIPTLTSQLPLIKSHYPTAIPLHTIPSVAKAHMSLRTVSLCLPQERKSESENPFPYHLKFSLNCQITSAVRNLHPPTVHCGPTLSELLSALLPEDLWVFKHIACATGSTSEPEKAPFVGCIIRESLESRAERGGECLIPAAVLYTSPSPLPSPSPPPSLFESPSHQPRNKPGEKQKCYAETLFSLLTSEARISWLGIYTRTLFTLLFPALVNHGIGLEAHAQNILLRVDKTSKEIKGFAVRDFDGLRVHRDTLLQSIPEEMGYILDGLGLGGADADAAAAGKSRNFVQTKEEVWRKVHHAVLQLHVSPLVHALGLEGSATQAEAGGGGWTIVREELERVLLGLGAGGREVYEFMTREKMDVKCFLRMRMGRVSGDLFDGELPNILLRD
ncbi:ferric iron reductase FhuF-like transporter-domain-containing protein [Aspergillus karnatakaensis]|uniref:ferric iron reductase FhuF-like transporter-domain-containing protein n=1 Tax=Aspergillus karnatakaensis TaxID=1810916 RepID=UPI003CCD1926